MKLPIIFLSVCLLLACDKKDEKSMITISNPNNGKFTYLALGDSYTIGASVPEQDAFPYQLVKQLNTMGLTFSETPKIIAKTGWTTADLQTGIRSDNEALKYDLVTLLIGVNNQYRGYSINDYRYEFRALLQTAINFAGGNKKRVFVISIPDWGVTPYGKASGRDQKEIAREIDEFNAVNQAETLAMGISYTDITPGSRAASTDPKLIAVDDLHPSGKMYASWVAALAPKIAGVF